jgi:hypothetical protein
MPQVNHSERDMMSTQEVGVFPVKADEQGTKLIDPGETTFIGEAAFVDLRVEQAFAPPFGSLAIAFVLGDVRDHTIIETDFPGFTGIEGTVGVEKRACDVQAQALQAFEGRLEVRLEVEGIVVIARHHARRSENIPVSIHDGQNVARLGSFATLIRYALAAFLGNRMTAIQVQLTQVKVGLHRVDARLPDLFQAPIGAPLAKVVVHCLPTDFFFVASCGPGAVGNWFHWQPVCSRYRM